MSLLNFFRKKPADEFSIRADLVGFVTKRVTDRSNRIRCEDALCAAAAIVGERCIDAAGEYSVRDHELAPGSRVFSDRINQFLCGDAADVSIDTLPSDSVYGILKAGLSSDAYPLERFPTLYSVFAGFSASVGRPEDWGKVPVTVVPSYHPSIVPLQFAFETRDAVDAIFEDAKSDKIRCLAITTKSLAALMNQMAGAIDPQIALRLAFEIVNGMAKTAPMTKKAFAVAQQHPPTRAARRP